MPKDIQMTEGFQISKDVPVLGGIRVLEDIRLPENVWVPEFCWVLYLTLSPPPSPSRSLSREGLRAATYYFTINYI